MPIRISHRSKRPRPPAKELSGGCLIPFGLLFALPGIAIAFFLGIRPLLKVQDARSWAQVPATVLSSSVGTHRGSDSTTYSIDITFSYRVENREYTSDRYNFATGSSSGYDRKNNIVRAYPPGHTFQAFVNPNNPAEAVINPKFEWIYLALLCFGLLFFVVGAGIVIAGIRTLHTRPAAPGSVQNNVLPALPPENPPGSFRLKSDSGPLAKVFGTLFIALFWNGIVTVFLFEVIQTWQSGRPDYFLTVFLIPFLLVGIGIIFGFLHSLLAAFNPRLNLRLSSALPHPGDSVTLHWDLSGAAHRLQSFSVSLEALEHITYRTGSGKNSTTHTHERVFFRQPLLDASNTRRLTAGTLQFEIPHNLPHSFDAPNNKIIWRIRAHGDIPFWPDLKQSFPLPVLPQPVS